MKTKQESGVAPLITMLVFCMVLVVLMVSSSCFYAHSGESSPESLPIRVLFEGVHCGGIFPEPQVLRVADEKQLENMFRQMGAAQVGTLSDPSLKVDFSDEEVLLISMGQQRTGGYRLSLHMDRAVVSNGRTKLSLNWTQPSSDDMVTQALTDPCIMMALPKSGSSRILVVDQFGELKLEAVLSRR